MQWLSPVLLAIQVISSLGIIVLVLLQQGKGADMGSSFGSGSAGSLFGASGAANFLSRTTKWAAIIFFASTAGLAYVAHHPGNRSIVEGGVMQGFQGGQAPSTGSDVPVAPSGSPVPAAPSGSAVPAAPAPAQPQSAAPAEAPSAPAASGSASGATQAPADKDATKPAKQP